MYVVVGLGNPGKQYENTRHNVGFNVIDILAKEYDISVTKIKHKALIGEGRIGSEKVLLVKPQTYMNLSGETLIDIYKYYKVDLDNIIVIYDDIDLDVGKLRIRKKGSAGTHNGMRSIEQADLEIGLEKAYKAVEAMIKENVDIAMNKYNG